MIDGGGKQMVRIGFDHPFQPFAYLEGEKPRGSLIELVEAVMAHAGLALEWAPMTLDQTEPALYSGAVDALAFKGVTPERAPTMDFSATLTISGEALVKGEVQLAALNFQAGIQIANDLHPGRVGLPRAPYAPLPLAFAVAKGRHAELLVRFNAALLSMQAAARVKFPRTLKEENK